MVLRLFDVHGASLCSLPKLFQEQNSILSHQCSDYIIFTQILMLNKLACSFILELGRIHHRGLLSRNKEISHML